MIKLSKLRSKARVAEVAGVANNLLEFRVTTGEVENPILTDILTRLSSENKLLLTAIDSEKILSQLEEADDARDLAYRDLYRYVQGLTYAPNADAAKRVFGVLKRHGLKIASLAYREETAKLESIFIDLKKLQTDVDSIASLEDMLANLNLKQNEFMRIFNELSAQRALEDKTESASKIKPRVLDIINNELVEYLRPTARYQPETYGEYAQKVSNEIDSANEIMRRRISRASSTHDADEM